MYVSIYFYLYSLSIFYLFIFIFHGLISLLFIVSVQCSTLSVESEGRGSGCCVFSSQGLQLLSRLVHIHNDNLEQVRSVFLFVESIENCSVQYRVTFHKNCRPPQDCHRALMIVQP